MANGAETAPVQDAGQRAEPLSVLPAAGPIPRLTALWGLHESGLGGILHALRVPLKGIVLAGGAVFLIRLLTSATPAGTRPYRTIMRAAPVAALIKLGASPHSPPTAYLALFFQALTGAFLFTLPLHRRVASVVLGGLALGQSASQRILVLTLLFGLSLWSAVDVVGRQILSSLGSDQFLEGTHLGIWLVGVYIAGHVFCGLCLGWWAESTARRVVRLGPVSFAPELALSLTEGDPGSHAAQKQPVRRVSRKARRLLVLFVLGLTVAWILAFLYPEGGGVRQAAVYLLRTLSLLLVWFGIILPLGGKLVSFCLRKYRRKAQSWQEIQMLVPEAVSVVRLLWRESHRQKLKRFSRLHFFCTGLARWAIHTDSGPTIK